MNYSLLPLNARLVMMVLLVMTTALFLSLALGNAKSWQEISWLDVSGEGGIALLTLVWIFFLLVSRPPGRVTSLLVSGLSFFMFSALLDLLDEFMRYPQANWLSLIESIPAPIGMIMMTWALYQWHQEQLTLNAQLRRREARYREHLQVDWVTRLYSADYMREQLSNKLTDPNSARLAVVMLDIDDFDHFNRRYGDAEGDRLLREISELILMNIRQTDLACRYAGDRFILMLPDTLPATARTLAEQICTAIRHLAFKAKESGEAVYHTLSFAVESVRDDDRVEDLLGRVNQRLDLARQGQG